jgi:hypothetical protein
MNMKYFTAALVFLLSGLMAGAQPAASPLIVLKTTDFEIDGKGTADNWKATTWVPLTQRDPAILRKNNWQIPLETDTIKAPDYRTEFKILYSDNGVYCLYHCQDSAITATITEDFSHIYDEDVVEAFFWPDTKMPTYFEYELSPLNVELPILIINNRGHAMGWKPWHYEGGRKTRHAVQVEKNSSGNMVKGWTAEFFIPFALLAPLDNVPPKKGTTWRANFYRIDYDRKPTYTSWQLTRQSYHDYENFGTIRFE